MDNSRFSGFWNSGDARLSGSVTPLFSDSVIQLFSYSVTPLFSDSVIRLRQPREMSGQGQHCVPDGTPGFVHVSVFYQHRIPDGMPVCRAGHIVSTGRCIPIGLRRAQSVRIASFGRKRIRKMPSASRQRCTPDGMTNPVSSSITPLFSYSVIQSFSY